MNAKAAKRLRREMRVLLNIDPRECMYVSRDTRSGVVPLDGATGLFLVRRDPRPIIRLAAGCGRHLYREAKRQTRNEFSGHSV